MDEKTQDDTKGQNEQENRTKHGEYDISSFETEVDGTGVVAKRTPRCVSSDSRFKVFNCHFFLLSVNRGVPFTCESE